MTPWYIDAIDVRGGLAVATQRSSDLKFDALAEVGPSTFISPPAFIPEFVETRSTGFALARARGQAGLFHNEDEVRFDSLAAVAEFVRRSFLRGAGGDGTGENGGSTPPPSPEDSGPLEALRPLDGSTEHSDLAAALLNLARANSARSQKLEKGMSHPGEPLAAPDIKNKDVRTRRLARGALHVLRELIRRRPNRQPDKLHWSMVLEKLIQTFDRMGLQPPIFYELQPVAGASWIFGNDYHPSDDLDYLLFEYYHNRHSSSDLWHWRRHYMSGSMTDMFDDLAVFPVPSRTVPFAPKDGQNLQAILSAFIATPNKMLFANDRLEQECAELAVFAAAYLNLGGEYSVGFRASDDYCYEFCDRLVVKAQTWLGSNIPRYVYATQVEDLIADASTVPA